MKKLFTILTLLNSATLIAQDFSFGHPKEEYFDFGFDIEVGGKFSNIEDLNKILKEEELPESKTNLLYIGGGMNFIYGNHLLHFNGNGAFDEVGNDLNGFRTKSRGWGAGINYGYRIGLSIFNLVSEFGIARDALVIEVEELANQNSGIRTRLNTPNVSKLNAEVFAASIGFRILFYNDFGTMFPGLNFSYQIPITSEWKTGDFDIENTPNVNVARFKLGIEILFLTGQNDW